MLGGTRPQGRVPAFVADSDDVGTARRRRGSALGPLFGAALASHLPADFLPLQIDQLPLAESRIRLSLDRDGWQVSGLPDRVKPL